MVRPLGLMSALLLVDAISIDLHVFINFILVISNDAIPQKYNLPIVYYYVPPIASKNIVNSSIQIVHKLAF